MLSVVTIVPFWIDTKDDGETENVSLGINELLLKAIRIDTQQAPCWKKDLPSHSRD